MIVDNALPISSWYCDPKDTALLDLLPLLDSLRFIRDVRTVLSRHKNIAYPLKSSMKVSSRVIFINIVLLCFSWMSDLVW